MTSLAQRFIRVFTAPTFPDLEKTRQCQLLNLLAWTLIFAALLGLFAGLLTSTPEPAYFLRVATIFPFAASSLWLMKNDRIKFGSLLFSYSAWLYVTLLLFSSQPATFRANFGFYYPTIIAGGLLLGARGALIFFALSAISLIFLTRSGPIEILVAFNPIRNTINLIVGILVATIYTAAGVDRLNQALKQASTEKTGRQTSEKELHDERDLVKALTEASTAVSGSLVFEEVLDSIMEQVSKVIPSDAVNIMLIEGEKARIVRWRGYEQFGAVHQVANKVFEIDATPNLKTMRDKGEPIGAANTANSPNWVRSEEFSWLQSYVGAPIKVKSKVVGFLNVDSARPDFYSPDQLKGLQAFAGQIAVTVENTQLFSQVQEYAEQLENAFLETTLALAKTLDVRDTYVADHSELISKRAEKTLRALGGSERDIMQISLAAKLHDIGKIGVPDQILHKAGPLSDSEWVAMKKHPQIGGEIVRRVKGLEEVATIIEAHQEKYDGSGYPLGLKGEAIPFMARILSVVDAYGAMTEDRVYRDAKTHAEAVTELLKQSGKQFDPEVVKAFLDVIAKEELK